MSNICKCYVFSRSTFTKTKCPFQSHLGASYIIHKIGKLNLLYDVYGFYRCGKCKGVLLAECSCCNEGKQLSNKYNFDTNNVICEKCVVASRTSDIAWYRDKDFFKVTLVVLRNKSNQQQLELRAFEYRGCTILIPYYIDDRYNYSRNCLYCCQTFNDGAHLSDVVKEHKLDPQTLGGCICGKCIIDFFCSGKSGIFTKMKRSMDEYASPGGDGICDDDSIL